MTGSPRARSFALIVLMALLLCGVGYFALQQGQGGEPLPSGGGTPSETAEPESAATSETTSVEPSVSVDPAKTALVLRIRDAAGIPMEGVSVVLDRGGFEGGTTDGDGVAAFRGIPAGSYGVVVSFGASGESLASAQPLAVRLGEVNERLCVVRPRLASISGRVLDPKGAALPGRLIRWSPVAGDAYELPMLPRDVVREVTSDPEGGFVITGLAGGEYSLEIPAEGGFGSARRLAAAPSSGIVLALTRAQEVELSGHVVDSEGRDLEGVSVTTSSGGQVKTDRRGRYGVRVQVSRAPGVTLAVSATKAGYSGQHKTSAVPEDLGEDGIGMDFVLHKALDVTDFKGVVLGSNGEPVGGEAVLLSSLSRGVQLQTVTSEAGEFVFPGARHAKDYVVRVFPVRAYKDLAVERVEIGPEAGPLQVNLEPMGAANLNGTIVNAAGEPLPGFSLWIKSLDQMAGAVRATSDEEGRFRVEVPVGELLVETRAIPKATIRGLRIEAGQEFGAVFPIGSGDREVTGYVVLPNGSPVAGAKVVVTWRGGADGLVSTLFHESLSDPDGRFAVPGFGPGRGTVTATAVGVDSARGAFLIPEGGRSESVRLVLR